MRTFRCFSTQFITQYLNYRYNVCREKLCYFGHYLQSRQHIFHHWRTDWSAKSGSLKRRNFGTQWFVNFAYFDFNKYPYSFRPFERVLTAIFLGFPIFVHSPLQIPSITFVKLYIQLIDCGFRYLCPLERMFLRYSFLNIQISCNYVVIWMEFGSRVVVRSCDTRFNWILWVQLVNWLH